MRRGRACRICYARRIQQQNGTEEGEAEGRNNPPAGTATNAVGTAAVTAGGDSGGCIELSVVKTATFVTV